jgi:hypothetical protein
MSSSMRAWLDRSSEGINKKILPIIGGNRVFKLALRYALGIEFIFSPSGSSDERSRLGRAD